MELKKTLNYVSSSFSKGLPYDLEAERSLLGALILDLVEVETFDRRLRPQDFFQKENKDIYQAILGLSAQGNGLDPVSIRAQMETNKTATPKLIDYLGELTFNLGDHDFQKHAEIIIELSQRRQALFFLEKQRNSILDRSTSIDSICSSVVNCFFEIAESPFVQKVERFSVALDSHLQMLDMRQKSQRPIGLKTGLKELDRLLGGWKEGDITIIGARPGMGKTSLLLKFLREGSMHARESGGSVLFFSLEMSQEQILSRFLSGESGISGEKFRDAKFSQEDLEWLNMHSGAMRNLPIFLDDTPNITIDELKVKARRLAKKEDLKAIYIDYLQLMTLSKDQKKYRAADKNQEVSELSKELKGLARELKLPIIVASQLSRAVEIRGASKVPQLSDLRDSGTIEQDASNVIFIHRPEYYGVLSDKNGNSCEGLANLVVSKHRHGDTGVVTVRFNSRSASFLDV